MAKEMHLMEEEKRPSHQFKSEDEEIDRNTGYVDIIASKEAKWKIH